MAQGKREHNPGDLKAGDVQWIKPPPNMTEGKNGQLQPKTTTKHVSADDGPRLTAPATNPMRKKLARLSASQRAGLKKALAKRRKKP